MVLLAPQMTQKPRTEPQKMPEGFSVAVVFCRSVARLFGRFRPAIGPRPWPWAQMVVSLRMGGRDVAPHRGACDGATSLPVGLHRL